MINNFLLTLTQKQNTALNPVPRKIIGERAVYNLTVEDEKEFFANGVLVHNCDALRYALFTHKVSKPAPLTQMPGRLMI